MPKEFGGAFDIIVTFFYWFCLKLKKKIEE